jgi:hypothetical protein
MVQGLRVCDTPSRWGNPLIQKMFINTISMIIRGGQCSIVVESHVHRVLSFVVLTQCSTSGARSSSLPQMFRSDLRSVATAPRAHSNSLSP